MTLYDKISFEISKIITKRYSTSFSLGIIVLDKDLQEPIYSIYGLVRVADEIVDTFHDLNKEQLLSQLKKDTYRSIEEKLSTNPVLNAFQHTVNKYKIPLDLVEAFFNSMEMDLYQGTYSRSDYDKYVYGSAEVVGLMCLKVFVNGEDKEYERLSFNARTLGSAFQKVNFLRDLGNDLKERNRIYLPEVYDVQLITNESKNLLVQETEKEFSIALDGIKRLPPQAKLGVYLAYLYYKTLLRKIKNSSVETLKTKRIRVNDFYKIILLIIAFIRVRILRTV